MAGKYMVAVIGGACAGSETADRLAEAGMEVVVFEQNALPYGKIEDGLPRWHLKMQNKECHTIDGKLNREGVHFVPNCKLGQELTPQNLIEDWGFHMVVMANGAWRDRPLRIPGAELVTDDSLIYQNAFVYWFNHYEDANYQGERIIVPPGAAVIGGGLASLDVVKIFQFEIVKNELARRGLSCDLLDMEHKGIHKTLEQHGLTWEQLQLEPAKLIYRKRVRDMPLVPMPDNPSAEKLEKAAHVREKLINNAVRKYGFEVYTLHSPKEVVAENGSLKAVRFEKLDFREGRFAATGEQTHIKIPLLVSSIGSLPEPIEGIPMDGELYHWEDPYTGQVAGLPKFYCVGNAITGRGNIKESLANARRLGEVISGGIKGEALDYERLFREAEAQARVHVERLLGFLHEMTPLTPHAREHLMDKVKQHWKRLGYQDYSSWCESVIGARGKQTVSH